MEKKITLAEWIDIVETTLEEVYKRFSDDGKISVVDGIGILVTVLKAIAKAYQND